MTRSFEPQVGPRIRGDDEVLRQTSEAEGSGTYGQDSVAMIIIVMGVSGSGKSTIGRQLADRLACDFVDGDDLHPAENVAKMAAGEPLDDDDRWPWLERIADLMRGYDGSGRNAVIACSALRRVYRDLLSDGSPDVRYVYLRGSPQTVLSRMNARADHFMPADLLDSQFEALEEPANAIVVDIEQSVGEIVDAVAERLRD